MKKKPDLVLLGLMVSRLSLHPGERRGLRDLAAFACAAGGHISWQRIQQIEQQGLRKIRAALYRDQQLQQEFFHHGHK